MLKIVLSLFIFTLSLYSYSNYELLKTYRSRGIQAVISKIESGLEEKAFWQEHLEKIDTTYGYYEKYRLRFLFASKEDNRLYLIDKIGNNFEPIKYYDMINGINGDKQIKGDLKTPLGVYPLDRFDPRNQFYGPISFNLHFPSMIDKLIHKKTGSGIWLHGYPMNGEKRNPQTKGCLALKNYALKDLDTYLKGLKHAFIIIAPDDKVLSLNKDNYASILAELFKWKKAWKNSKVNDYLKFYDKKFKRYDGKNLRQFSAMKRIIFGRGEKKTITFKQISIIPVPSSDDRKIFKISFFENYKTQRVTFNGNKTLFIELKNDKMKILVEK